MPHAACALPHSTARSPVSMECARFRAEAEKLVKSLEACGRSFLRVSTAEISISQFDEPAARDVLYRLTELPNAVHMLGEAPLSLAEARTLFNSCLLDALFSVVSRLQWAQFSTQLDLIAVCNSRGVPSMRGMVLADNALACLAELLHAWQRVSSFDGHETARLETFSRWFYWLEVSAWHQGWFKVVSGMHTAAGSRARSLFYARPSSLWRRFGLQSPHAADALTPRTWCWRRLRARCKGCAMSLQA